MDGKPKASKLAEAIVRLARSARRRAVKLRCDVREKRPVRAQHLSLKWSSDARQ